MIPGVFTRRPKTITDTLLRSRAEYQHRLVEFLDYCRIEWNKMFIADRPGVKWAERQKAEEAERRREVRISTTI